MPGGSTCGISASSWRARGAPTTATCPPRQASWRWRACSGTRARARFAKYLYVTRDSPTAPTHEAEQCVAFGAPSDYSRAYHFEELCGSILKIYLMAAAGRVVASGEEQRIFKVTKRYFQHAGGADNALEPNGTARTVVAAVNRVLGPRGEARR
jgi:hypothetical protein